MANMIPKSPQLWRVTACLCGCLNLLIWFLPGSYSYLYLDAGRTELWVTSLFSFFPAPVLLLLICAGITLWAACTGKTTRSAMWTLLAVSVLQCLYLGFIGAICLPHFHGETFIWLQALPFPLTIAGGACCLLTYRTTA